MKNKILLIVLGFWIPLDGVSPVYNIRITATTRRYVSTQKNKYSLFAATILVNQWATTRNGIKRYAVGPIAFYMKTFKSGYISVSGGGGYIRQNITVGRGKRKRAQTDDVLFMGGHRCAVSENIQLTVSGLVGIPTHKDTVFEGVEFGTGHVGVGGQLDAAWFFAQEKTTALMAAFRYFYLIPELVKIPAVSARNHYTFSPGNFIDLLFAYQIGALPNSFEVGYNPSFAFGAALQPIIPALNSNPTVIRSSFYANYKHIFLLGEHPSGVGLGLSYGFDHKPKDIGFKRIVTLWCAWGINF